MKDKTVYLRLFEPEDFEKTYIWHNDFDLQKTTCGSLKFVSKEIEKNWVLSKATHNQTDIYLAICLIENSEMIGWISINNIDYINRKCKCGGVVISKDYQDGMAYLESSRLMHQYVFDEMNINMLQGGCLEEQITSRANMEANYYVLEGIERQAVFKDGRYHNICHYSLSSEEFNLHREKGDYKDSSLIRRMIKIAKNFKCY